MKTVCSKLGRYNQPRRNVRNASNTVAHFTKRIFDCAYSMRILRRHANVFADIEICDMDMYKVTLISDCQNQDKCAVDIYNTIVYAVREVWN